MSVGYHVGMTVSSVLYRYIVDPDTYSEVDIVDWAPRAVTGTPHRSELGLYLDLGQEDYGHGYGNERFVESAMYANTGHLVDTSQGFASLYTLPVNIANVNTYVYQSSCNHRGHRLFGTNNALYRAGTSSLTALLSSIDVRDLLSNGTYFFIATSGTMKVCDIGQVTTANATSCTATIDHGWTTNIFVGGNIYIYEGTGSGTSTAITGNTDDTIQVAGWGTQPDNTSKFLVYDDAGSAVIPPQNFYKLASYGGYMWGCEYNVPWLHYWSESDGSDAEGQQSGDLYAIHVGPGDILINNMVPFSNQLWVMREDGAWAIGDDNVAYHILDFSNEAHTDNFKAACVWNGFLWFSIRNTLYKYKSGLQEVTPPRWDEHWPYKTYGDFSALVPRGKFMYVIARSNEVNSLETTETAAHGVILKTDAVGWHKVADVSDASAIYGNMNMWIDPQNDRLYYAYRNNAGTKVSYLNYVTLQPYSELTYASYPTTGNHRLYTSYIDAGLMRVDKSFASVTVDAEFPTNTSIACSYRTDDNTTLTSLGTFTSSTKTLNFSSVTGKRIQLVFDLQTSSGTVSPILKAHILKCMARPSVLYGVSFEVIVEDELATPDGERLGSTASEMRTSLKAARASVAPITFTNIFGESSSAYLTSLRFIVRQYSEDGNRYASARARCTIAYV